MGVRKLAEHSNGKVRFCVGRESAALLLELEDGSSVCLVIEGGTGEDLEKVAEFGEISSARVIGGEPLVKSLREVPALKGKIQREVVSNFTVETIYNPNTGKVRIRKDQLSGKAKTKKKKVLIVDDSKTIQKLLKRIIDASEHLEVMAVADRPSAAREIIEKERPDLITLDIHMPEMNGVEFLKSYLCSTKIPVAMVSSVSVEEGPLVMEALTSGALTYIQKPSVDMMGAIASDVREQLELISNSGNGQKSFGSGLSHSSVGFDRKEGIVVIGSSTGGTKALQEIFTRLPATIPPIVVVQHIPAVFSKALAERLDGICPFVVKEAENGDPICENTVYIAPGGMQMKLVKKGVGLEVALSDDAPVNRFKPSVDYLFNSVSELRLKNVVGALLTGMGKDGAAGLLKLKNSGAYTIAQDEASCVVFGMPKEAIKLQAQNEIVHLSDIPRSLQEAFNRQKSSKL